MSRHRPEPRLHGPRSSGGTMERGAGSPTRVRTGLSSGQFDGGQEGWQRDCCAPRLRYCPRIMLSSLPRRAKELLRTGWPAGFRRSGMSGGCSSFNKIIPHNYENCNSLGGKRQFCALSRAGQPFGVTRVPVPPVRARYAVPLRDLNRGGALRPVVAGAARQVAPTEDPVWHGNPR